MENCVPASLPFQMESKHTQNEFRNPARTYAHLYVRTNCARKSHRTAPQHTTAPTTAHFVPQQHVWITAHCRHQRSVRPHGLDRACIVWPWSLHHGGVSLDGHRPCSVNLGAPRLLRLLHRPRDLDSLPYHQLERSPQYPLPRLSLRVEWLRGPWHLLCRHAVRCSTQVSQLLHRTTKEPRME
jgi:hypothetical protein